MTIKTYLLTLLLLLSFSIQAEQTDASSKSSSMPIDLVADKGSYDQLAGLAVYEGNVRVTQGISTIWADKITIILKNNAAESVEAIGKPVKFEYLGDKQPIKGQGQKAIYNVVEKIITLSGEAVVTQGEDVIKGSQLTYHLDKELIKGDRVKMTFLPKND